MTSRLQLQSAFVYCEYICNYVEVRYVFSLALTLQVWRAGSNTALDDVYKTPSLTPYQLSRLIQILLISLLPSFLFN